MAKPRDGSTGREATDETFLSDYYPRRPAHFCNWPEPVHERLNDLVDDANNAGARTVRYELVAAIVSFTDLDPEGLLEVVQLYRKAKVGDLTR